MPWFESWFDSPYYHILYQNRNELEAETFLDHLLSYLNPKSNASMLDLGCGRGRHALYMNERGYNVTGIDLSEQSIQYCVQYENATLSFFVHDMRTLFRVNDFDFVFNLFTSFGYFEKEAENIAAVRNACFALKKGGTLVIDYLNTDYVTKHLVKSENVEVEGIHFKINKEFKDGFFRKDIRFTDAGNEYHFTEKVAGLLTSDFEKYMNQSGMRILKLFGDYNLNDFNSITSPRLILVAVKE
ncbi:MAG: class I SAM-dependent methyltransferase [Bacteroidetes bacterium]|nr:class I SAM-dependent methyltransferase [Bacteroidota bacterium]